MSEMIDMSLIEDPHYQLGLLKGALRIELENFENVMPVLEGDNITHQIAVRSHLRMKEILQQVEEAGRG